MVRNFGHGQTCGSETGHCTRVRAVKVNRMAGVYEVVPSCGEIYSTTVGLARGMARNSIDHSTAPHTLTHAYIPPTPSGCTAKPHGNSRDRHMPGNTRTLLWRKPCQRSHDPHLVNWLALQTPTVRWAAYPDLLRPLPRGSYMVTL